MIASPTGGRQRPVDEGRCGEFRLREVTRAGDAVLPGDLDGARFEDRLNNCGVLQHLLGPKGVLGPAGPYG